MGTIILMAAVFATFYAVMKSSRIRDFLVARKWFVRAVGVFVMAAGIIVPIALLGQSTGSEKDLVSDAAPFAILAGLLLLFLPGAAGRMPAALAAAQAARRAPEREVSPFRDAITSITAPLRNAGPFARIAGPWMLLLWSTAAGAIWWADLPHQDIEPTTALFVLLALIVGVYVSVAAVAPAWHRFVLHGSLPRLVALPGRSALPFMWRLLLLMMIFGAANRGAAYIGERAKLYGLDERVVSPIAGWAVTILFVFAFSTQALAFPAIAEGKRVPFGWAATLGPRVRRFSVGWVLTVVPFLAAGALLSNLSDGGKLVSSLAQSLAFFAVLFWAVVACADYLARSYEAIRGNLEPTLAS